MSTVTKTCAYCGKEFEILNEKREISRRKYCGKECFQKSIVGHRNYKTDPTEAKICLACGKPFLVGGRGRPVKRTKLCSWECQRASRYRHSQRCNELNTADAAYLAGFLDGEGCISICSGNKGGAKGSAYLRVTLSNSNRDVLDWSKIVTGIGGITHRGAQSKKHKEGFQFVVHGDGALTLLKQLRPYLKIKTEQADLGIACQERVMNPALKADRSWQAEWKQKMHDLNRRGPSTEG